MSQTDADDARRSDLPAGLSRLGDHWGVMVGYGVTTFAVGLVLVLWPEQTLVVLAVFLAVQLMVTGVVRVAHACAASAADGGVRALLGLSGGLSLTVGLLCLRAPLQTVLVLGLLVGVWLMVNGVVDVVSALLGHAVERWWKIFMGVVSFVAGAYLVVNPDVSLQALVVIVAAWLFGYGAIAVIAGFQLRSASRSAAVTA